MGIATAFRALPSKFNIVRVCIYTVVILWSIICLGIAAHLASVLTSSELTRFVPFAIFVSVASILVMFCLIAFGVWSNMNPITVRIELACLGLVGTLWLALGAFLASSESQDADVECFAAGADDNSMPTDEGGFTTETFQAEYRVLLAFSLFNLILVASFLALLLLLAIRRYTAGDRAVWHDPVPSVTWFGPIKATKSTSHSRSHQQQRSLPTPVTEKPNRPRTHSRSLSIAALFASRGGGGSGGNDTGTRGDAIAKPSYTKPVDEHYVWVPEQPRPGERARVDRDNTRTTAGTRGDRAPATTNTRVERATAGTRGQVGARGERERERTARAGAAATPLTAAQLERDNTRSTGTTRLERDNTRSTAHSRTPLVEPPSRNNTRSTTASASRREPDRFTAPPERTSSRRNRERERERESSRDRDYDGPSRNNTRSTQATRTTTDSRRDRDRDRGRGREERASERAVVVPAPAPAARQTSGSGRKPDYYRRDLSPRR